MELQYEKYFVKSIFGKFQQLISLIYRLAGKIFREFDLGKSFWIKKLISRFFR